MPYKVKKGSGKRPWKIYNTDTGKLVGSSVTKKKAEACVRARLGASHGWTPRRRG